MRLKYDRTYRIRLYILIFMAALLFLVFLYTYKGKGESESDQIRMINLFLSSEMYGILSPAFISFLCSDLMYEDVTSRYIYLHMSRTGRHEYIKTKIKEIFITAVIFTIGSFVLYHLVSSLIRGGFSYYSLVTDMTAETVGSHLFRMFISLVLMMIWGLEGSAFSLILNNRSGGYVFPFVINYLMIWLKENYLRNTEILDPSFWMQDRIYSDPLLKEGTVVFLLIMLAVSVTVYYIYVSEYVDKKE